MFLNDSNRIMPNGITSAIRPTSFESNMKIQLYASIKNQMDQG